MLLRTRRRRKLTVEPWHTFASLGSLLVAAGLGLVLASGHVPARSWVVAYGYAALAGWFGFAGVLAGLLLADEPIVRVAGIAYAGGALLFAANAARLALPLAVSRRSALVKKEITA